ncbi:uncharacterized protein METZ01_LOCUS172845 [marine metagenome]|uniref:Uncharacterized protein n=1 Tax=marine metagenome TaxID=408172 RepID=A0A382C2M8_9ZZZZ|tara:strand:+ start:349 stop:474 length:126 start_codon:yes stop_codon:yes gene_type:complete
MKTSLALSSLLILFAGGVYAEKLICDYPENKKKKVWYSVTL